MKTTKSIYVGVLCSMGIFFSCNNMHAVDEVQSKKDSAHSCMSVPNRFAGNTDSNSIIFSGDTSELV